LLRVKRKFYVQKKSFKKIYMNLPLTNQRQGLFTSRKTNWSVSITMLYIQV